MHRQMTNQQSLPQQFTPERIPRRGESLAWLFALVVIATWLILRANGQNLTTAAAALAALLFLSAASISLGNWMDRQTVIRLTSDGIAFRNGLRDVSLTWNEVQSVRVFPGRFGAKQVQVLGQSSHFEFRTPGEVRYNDEVRGRTGFEHGEQILQAILKFSNLKTVDHQDPRPNVYYYVRK